MSAPEKSRSRSNSAYLEPPAVSHEVEDPGVEQSASSSEDEHFSDALEEGHLSSVHNRSRSTSPSRHSRPSSPVPRTRVERVDDEPSYGEVPGSPAYEKRQLDAVPDEVAVQSRSSSRSGPRDSSSRPHSRSLSVPRTVVEKVDVDTPSYGEDPSSPAFKTRMADAAPDYIFKMEQNGDNNPHIAAVLTDEPQVTENPDDKESTSPVVVPETRVSRVDTLPLKEKKRILHKRNPSDAQPDHVEDVSETGSPSSPSRTGSTGESRTSVEQLEGETDEVKNVAAPEPTEQAQDDFDNFNDDFDDFEAGDVNAAEDDDFGDFDDFETVDAAADVAADLDTQTITTDQSAPDSSLPPVIDFDDLNSLSDLLDNSQSHLDTLFPSSQNIDSLPPVPPIQDSFAIFITDRSRSLWSQLIAPPPLQPPNWVRSRIRRLFLVSLGVPVDLDQILPAKKQKKLVLYSTQDTTSTWTASKQRGKGTPGASTVSTPAASRPSSGSGNATSTTTASSRRRGPPPPPELDFTAVRQLYSMTDEALDGLTDSELREHISDLEDVTLTASKVLEYWLQRKDRQMGEKEAFEGVIENLVKHARQVRK